MKGVVHLILFIVLSSTLKAQEISILFIGNSLTYTNDLPTILKDVARLSYIKITTKSITNPNYGLEDHWKDNEIQSVISNCHFDFVIFQQGPSSQTYGRSSLIEFGGEIAKLCRKYGAKPVYFMVWPSINYYHTIDGVIANYQDAAELNNALLCPVGSVWLEYRNSVGATELYSIDGFHPSKKGSILASLTLLETLFPGTLNKITEDRQFNKWLSPTESSKLIPIIKTTLNDLSAKKNNNN